MKNKFKVVLTNNFNIRSLIRDHKLIWSLSFFLVILLLVGIFTCWWVYSPLKKVKELDSLMLEEILLGKEELSKHKAVVVGIIRDNAAELPAVVKYIEHIGNAFRDYKVIIFENDSTDGTKEILEDWIIANPKIRIISGTFKNIKRPEIGFLAKARNYYLDKLQNDPIYNDFDIVMVVDMDMDIGWDMRGIFDSFRQIDNWDVVCSNGIFPDGKMRDAFAFRNEEFPYGVADTTDYWSIIVPQIQKTYKVGSELIPVRSCFGGMAFYKKKFIQNCRYISKNNDCEHIAFHECLIEKEKARIVMNPSQLMHYKSKEDMILSMVFNNSIQYKIIYNIKKWLNLAGWRINASK